MEFNPKDLAHMDEMVKHSFGRKALIETATMKHEENWQDVATPYDICGEMCDLVVGKADKYIVFFSLEFLEVLVCEKGIDPKNITFVGDFIIESGLASKMYGVNVVTITKNDVIKNGKFSNDIFTLLAIDKQKEINNSESDMKFNKVAVIGNPPYNANSNGKDSTPLYHLFVESVIDNIKPDYFSFIIPSRWMVGGKGLDKHRERMMNDRRMKKIVHFAGDKEVFNTVYIKGGVNYFLFEKEHNGTCEFVNGNTTSHRYLNSHDIIMQDNNALSILEKVMNNSSKWISESCLSRKPFGLGSDFSEWCENGVKCYSARKQINFCNSDAFTDKSNITAKWKVVTSKGINPNKEGRFEVYNNLFVIEPDAICTETYLVVNTFNSEKEAINFISYMKSRFFRFMVSLRVLTQNMTKESFNWVPCVGDYSAPWNDAELYKKFNLTRQEVAYIESKIKAI